MAKPVTSQANVSPGALLICPNATMMTELLPLLTHNIPGVQIHSVKEYPDSSALTELVIDHHPRLCFLDVDTDSERALALIRELQLLDKALQIVVLLGQNEPDLILRCLRQGATEFLMRPFTAEELAPVLQRLSQLSPSMNYGSGGRIICVAPAKGACGASTIAANLATRKKALGANRLLLADLDPLTGTISFLLKLKSNYSIIDAMNLATSLDRDLWDGVVSNWNGIDVVLAPENPMDSISELQDPAPVLEFARQLYDIIIVDCAGLLGDWGLPLARVATDLLLVTTNELPALQSTQRVLGHLERHRVERSKVRLVVNRYSRDVGLSTEAISTALHTDVFAVIPSDYEAVQKALVEGKPVNSNSAFGKHLSKLARRLSGKDEAAETEAASSRRKAKGVSLAGLFSSLFSRATS